MGDRRKRSSCNGRRVGFNGPKLREGRVAVDVVALLALVVVTGDAWNSTLRGSVEGSLMPECAAATRPRHQAVMSRVDNDRAGVRTGHEVELRQRHVVIRPCAISAVKTITTPIGRLSTKGPLVVAILSSPIHGSPATTSYLTTGSEGLNGLNVGLPQRLSATLGRYEVPGDGWSAFRLRRAAPHG